jgi:hypothetical protein
MSRNDDWHWGLTREDTVWCRGGAAGDAEVCAGR